MYSFIWQSRTVSKPRQRHSLYLLGMFGVCTVLCIASSRALPTWYLFTHMHVPFNLFKIQTEFPLSHINWLIVYVYIVYGRRSIGWQGKQEHIECEPEIKTVEHESDPKHWSFVHGCVWWMVNVAYAAASLTDTAITRWDGRARGYVFCCLFAFNLTFI